MLKIAIAGVGWAGTRHVEAIRELGRKITVACLVDTDPDHLQAKAIELSVSKTYRDFRQALADPEINAVSICTPHHLHGPMALAAAEAGKHILCEKPLAPTVEEATRMINAAAQHDVKLYVAENLPYSPTSRFLREVVHSGKYIGELTFASFSAGFRAQRYSYPGRRAWLAEPEQGGSGTWLLHGIHSMAQLRYIFGEVETVYMREHKAGSFERTDLEGTVSGLLTLESGVNISVVQTPETRLPDELKGYRIHGDRGSLRASTEGCEIFSDAIEGEAGRLFLTYPTDLLSEYAQEMEAFADYVTDNATGPTTAESERRSLAIVQAGYESIQSGQPVHLKARFGAL